jgi:CheY-like chemotaxis protein
VEVVGNGRLAVERSNTQKFDLILMDLQMPEMDGWEATREIRQRDGELGVRIPILALTAHAMGEAQQQCLAAGMDAVIVKPFDPAQFYAAIEKIVGSAGFEDDRPSNNTSDTLEAQIFS